MTPTDDQRRRPRPRRGGAIGPLLDAIVGAPGVSEVIVVDDESSDDTAAIAAAAGATCSTGAACPTDGRARRGRSSRASRRRRRVGGDARRRHPPDPRLPTALSRRAIGERFDLVTVGGGSMPDRRAALAARGDADHARLPVRPTRAPRAAGRRWRTGSAWRSARSSFLDAAGSSRCRRRRRGRRARQHVAATGRSGRLPRRRRDAHRPDVRVGRRHVARLGTVAGAARGRTARAPARSTSPWSCSPRRCRSPGC